MTMNKKGIEMQFHWIFILIAGAIILAFFFSMAYKQKALSTQKLELTLATDIENIITTALISKETAQRIPIPTQGLNFDCTEFCDCAFNIDGAQKTIIQPIFAPEEITGTEAVLWTKAFNLPYRVTNFLYIYSPETKYYFIPTDQNANVQLLQPITTNIPPLINYEIINPEEISQQINSDYENTYFVYFTGEQNYQPQPVHRSFENAKALVINQNFVQFYKKDRNNFQLIKVRPYFNQATIYAAMFSKDDIMYECGLKNAFNKLAIISQVYAERAKKLEQQLVNSGKVWCTYGQCQNQATIVGQLCQQKQIAEQLSQQLNQQELAQLQTIQQTLLTANQNFARNSCTELF
ncbi:hypothetical protein COV18_03610 [Candidatus Woesearchaeota archaeon CG10_big_fil_rev_8_21_14_0_10_37_12]|nr:MAG: hypothetical protein COV18_03610 [Candidatus Woesearchaeota archaeon CG10_big_fil_rev_8_21_14_0_10_37_12]